MFATTLEYHKLQETKRHNQELEAQGRLGLEQSERSTQANVTKANAALVQSNTGVAALEEEKKQNRYRNLGNLVKSLVSVGGALFK